MRATPPGWLAGYPVHDEDGHPRRSKLLPLGGGIKKRPQAVCLGRSFPSVNFGNLMGFWKCQYRGGFTSPVTIARA